LSITAYGNLRHSGVAIGKQDYLSQVGVFVRPVFMATLWAGAPPRRIFPRCSLEPYDSDMGLTASPARTALKNSQLTSGNMPAFSGTGH